jgi:Mrp family chromosome partitioning ATPase
MVKGHVEKPGDSIPIVDIEVEHENHRYYTNGVSSHNTGVGKSMVMCHLAASYLAQSKNVLYITLEMSDVSVGERIDANLFDVDIGDLGSLEKSDFEN